MDKIIIRALAAECIIGINESERKQNQEVIINLEMGIDLSKPGKTDNMKDTLDYRELKKRILTRIRDSRFFLLEALAEMIANTCLEYDRILEVTVTIDKPGALSSAESVAVEITRRRE